MVERRRCPPELPSVSTTLSFNETSVQWVAPTTMYHFTETVTAIASVAIASVFRSLKGQNTWPDNRDVVEPSGHIVFLGLVTIGTFPRVLVNTQPVFVHQCFYKGLPCHTEGWEGQNRNEASVKGPGVVMRHMKWNKTKEAKLE